MDYKNFNDTCTSLHIFVEDQHTLVPDVPVAMTVARTADESPDDPNSQKLIYQKTVLDVGNHWNQSTNELKLPADSIYFFHMNAGTKSGHPVDMELAGIDVTPGLTHLSSNYDGVNTFGRDIILSGTAGTDVFVTMDDESDVYAGPDQQTSFTVFDVQSYMAKKDQAIFSVACLNNETSVGRIRFDTILVDVGDNWQSDSVFRVPVTGYYFLTVSAGIPFGTFYYMDIVVRYGNTKRIFGNDLIYSNSKMTSGTFLAYLHEGGSVYIESFASIPQSDFRMGSFFLLSVGLIITQPLVNLQHGMPTFMPIWNQAQNQLTLLY